MALIFTKRYELMELAKKYRLNKIYDLLDIAKPDIYSDAPACTDGKEIFINEEQFNDYSAMDQFFILCHETLHILYHHLDKSYYPEDIYKYDTVLNLCQDVVINEYLADRLYYKKDRGVYLDTLSEQLMARGIIQAPISFWGTLTTKNLYNRVMSNITNNVNNEDDMNKLMEALETIADQFSNDRKEQTEDQNTSNLVSKAQQQVAEDKINNALENMKKALKITQADIDYENTDRVAVAVGFDGALTQAANEIRPIDYKDMIKYIEQFVGNTAVIKSRHRSYTRPSRRIHLTNNMVAAGYKQTTTINKIQIYLDVSGSMNSDLVANLFGVLKRLYKKVPFDFYTFNHYIQKIDIGNTNAIYTSGGTNIQAVLDTIRAQQQDAAILITDCEDQFSLKKVNYNLMIYTNNKTFKSDNAKVKLTYFR